MNRSEILDAEESAILVLANSGYYRRQREELEARILTYVMSAESLDLNTLRDYQATLRLLTRFEQEADSLLTRFHNPGD